MPHKKICNYIFELGVLKKFRHNGTKYAGVINPDSIAEHIYRATVIGYVLAELEEVNPEKVVMICLFHDNAETRIGDLNKIAQKYLDSSKAEEKAYHDQVKSLPKKMEDKLNKLFLEYENPTTKEGIIAKDADILETAFQAKEYFDLGYKTCESWIDSVEKHLTTDSAKAILREVRTTEFTDWWQGLKKK